MSIDNSWKLSQLESIGRLTVSLSHLELEITRLLDTLLGIREDLGEVLYGEMMIDAKFKLASELTKKKFGPNSRESAIVSDYRKRGKAFFEFRNKVQHWEWRSPREYALGTDLGYEIRDDLPMAIISKDDKSMLFPTDLSKEFQNVEPKILELTEEISKTVYSMKLNSRE